MPRTRTYKSKRISEKESSKLKNNKKKVSFYALKMVRSPVNVKFRTKSGKLVQFKASEKVLDKKKVTFYVKEK